MSSNNLRPIPLPFNRSGMLDANTKLLLHFDGANAGTVFTDSSASPYTATRTGTPTTSTAQSKWGGSSGLFPGGSNYLNITDTGKLDFGTGEFCVDWWLACAAYPAGGGTALISGMSGNDWQIALEASGGLNIYQRNVAAILGVPSGSVPIGGWNHFAIQRRAGVLQWFINGVLSSSLSDARSLNIAGSFRIGDQFNGYMDELRVSNVSRYTRNFIPRSAPYN